MLDKGAVRINGVVKDYAWGNPDFIPSLVGGYSGKPQAEYWMGTHRNGEAVLEDGSKLSEYAGHELGFLLKILAIDNPLSIQCHPNKRQATDGWRREAKLRSEGAEVNYQDPNQKAEAFIALTPVLAMCGFQPLSSIRDNLKATVPEGFREIEPHFSSCWELYSALYSLSAEKKKAVIDELSQGIPESDDLSMLSVSGVIRRCLSLYPDDIGCLFPLILNMVKLDPGEGVFLEPGILHAYCYGNGVEVMTASDNVLRGGLTHMRMDMAELRRIAVFEQYNASKCKTTIDESGRKEYLFPCDDFKLVRIGAGDFRIRGEEESVGMVVDGHIMVETSSGQLEIKKGQSLYIPGGLDYTIHSEGSAYFARG